MEQEDAIQEALRKEPQVLIGTQTGNSSPQQLCSSMTRDGLVEKAEIANTTYCEDITARKVCRICLDSGGCFVSPCSCTGSMKYVHTSCLKEWLLKSLENISYSEFKKAKCEVCSTKFNFSTTRQKHLNWQHFKKGYYKNKESYIHFAIGMILLTLLALATIIILGLVNSKTSVGKIVHAFLVNGTDVNINIVLGALIVVIVTGMGIITVIFLMEHGVKSDVQVIEICNYSTIRQAQKGNQNKMTI